MLIENAYPLKVTQSNSLEYLIIEYMLSLISSKSHVINFKKNNRMAYQKHALNIYKSANYCCISLTRYKL